METAALHAQIATASMETDEIHSSLIQDSITAQRKKHKLDSTGDTWMASTEGSADGASTSGRRGRSSTYSGLGLGEHSAVADILQSNNGLHAGTASPQAASSLGVGISLTPSLANIIGEAAVNQQEQHHMPTVLQPSPYQAPDTPRVSGNMCVINDEGVIRRSSQAPMIEAPAGWICLRLIDTDIRAPQELFENQGLLASATFGPGPFFLDLQWCEMKLLLHWLRFARLPLLNRAEHRLMVTLAEAYRMERLQQALGKASDFRNMTPVERSSFDSSMMVEMEGLLTTLVLMTDISRPEEEGVNAASLARITYEAMVHRMDAALKDLWPGEKRLVSIEFRFPLSHARRHAISAVGNDLVREDAGQPGWDSMANSSSSGGRQTLWNSYRGDPGRQIFHRVFFDAVARRLYHDGERWNCVG
ncbi:hypothetical protein CBOM_07282 [Ceraceosorus bombacis]|uniref:Uncharacterized protein n=1 Tax=Ceraceosorus bombacis TaxID=401625 RepID=A0A0P1B8P0_9BASI|nr:hypothetical protein CBOM_07282 [Ceraceosorus bombacis]